MLHRILMSDSANESSWPLLYAKKSESKTMRFWGFSDFFKLFDSKKSYAAGENSHVRSKFAYF